jgi:heptosyltransferase-2
LKILVLQTAFAGDVVLAAPLAEGLKDAHPEAEVHFLVIPETAVLLKNNPFIRKVWTYDKRGSERGVSSFFRLAGKLRREGFDLAVVPHRSLRSALLVRWAGIPRRVGFRNSAGAIFFTDRVTYPENVHEVERNFRLIRTTGWNGIIPPPRLYPGPEEVETVDGFLNETGVVSERNLVAMAPGSVWPTKRWLPEGFAGAAKILWERYHVRSILIGGEDDVNLGDVIIERGRAGTVSAMGKLSLLASAELIRRCRVILTNDSAPLHLAAAVGIPVVAVFGPTVPAFGFGPCGEGHTIVEKELYCRPCSVHGGRRCREQHFRCMKDISVEEVLRALERYL